MTLRVKISARAASQIRRASEWWLENRPGAPGAIAKDVGETIAILAEQPGIGTKYAGVRAGEIRRLYLGRVGYPAAAGSRACSPLRFPRVALAGLRNANACEDQRPGRCIRLGQC